MAATGGSSASATRYDVFLSFRGPDTRNTFTDCLYRTMLGQGIVAYRDSEELHAGDRIDDLLRAVGDSKICIPILSRGYASSAWCLRELHRATELNESTGKPEILPIFFDVTPSDVKLRTELYVEDLKKHEQRHGGEIRQQWEAALRKVTDIKGWEVQGKPYGEVIDLVVKEVLHKLRKKQRPLDNTLVGVDEQVEAIMELLDANSSTGVRFMGIHGMGGIGKTTLAKIIFNKLCPRFDGRCSFIGNIRESSKGNGLVDLQKRLASEISDSRFVESFIDTDEGIDSIRRRAGSKEVLIVLDDLDKKEQLKKLVGGPETFGSGSIIIITTRAKQILDEEKGVLAYEVKQMNCDKALELFSLHAFNSVSPPGIRWNLSQEVVSTAGGLPLALEVIGSSLRGEDEEIWKDMLKRLKNAPHDGVLEKLEICYDALRRREDKEIFLDIACFFNDEKKSWATYFWDACNLNPRISLKKLAGLCLIKIVRGDVIWMHDQLRDLGRHIVCRECTQILTARSRLWNYEEALKVVQSRERKDKLQALNLVGHRPVPIDDFFWERRDRLQALNLVEHRGDPIKITDEELERMPHVKFLKLRAGTFVGDIKNYLQELSWFSWYDPPLDCRMANLHFENLVVFELSHNGNTVNWGGWNILKMANKLKVVSLLQCDGLGRTPDFSGCLSLERLKFDWCDNLREVDSSIGKLKDLTHLDIFSCRNFQTLPEDIAGLVSLKHFSIKDCHNVKKLPYSIGKLTSLFELDISGTGITSLPDSIGDAKQLSSLDLSYSLIEELPNSIGELTQLEFLSLRYCRGFRELPKSIGNLISLQNLDLSDTRIVEFPDSINNLKQLKVMRVASSPIRRLPASIVMLERLEELNANCCDQLGELPTEIGSLSSLQKLDLTDCNELQGLPKLPSSLNCLLVQSRSLQLVSDLNNLTNLVELLLSNLSRVPAQASNPMQSLQLQWVGKLSKLKKLSWGLSDIPVPLTELASLPQLRELTVSCIDCFINSVVVGPQLSNLKNLSILELYRCPLREIQLDGLELLRDLTVRSCVSLERLSVISSSFRKLGAMAVTGCPNLLEIRFLSMMESLEYLEVSECCSLKALCGLLNLKKLKELWIQSCNELRVIEDFEELELLDGLNIYECPSLEILTNVLNSKIPNHCSIGVRDCGKLPNIDVSVLNYGQYKQKILDGNWKTSNKTEASCGSFSVNISQYYGTSLQEVLLRLRRLALSKDEMENDSANKKRKRTD